MAEILIANSDAPNGGEVVVPQLPLESVHPEAAELDSDKPNLAELGAQLEMLARRVVKKNDEITVKNRTAINRGLSVTTALFVGESALANGVLGHSLSATSIGMFLGTAGTTICHVVSSKKESKKVGPVQIPEGYSIQCLRANQTSLAFENREAVAFVHPRQYAEGEQQTTSQARDRLHDALAVIEAAPTVTKVVLPVSALRKARLPHGSKKPYAETVLDMKLNAWVDSQYKDSEMSTVLTREAARRLAETLQQTQNQPLLHRTIDALAERFPLARLQLAEATDSNERLVPLLHTLLRRTLDGELPSAQRERGYGEHGYRLEPLLTQIDTTNKFNPLITQRRATNYAPVETKRLSRMTGDDEQLMTDVLERLESRGYSNLQLVSVALRLAEHRHEEVAVDTPAQAPTEQGDLPLGSDPIALHINSKTHPAQHTLAKRSFGRIAAVGLMGAFLGQGAAVGLDALNAHLSKSPGVINEADIIWRVDEHGLSSAGHYTQTAYDHFSASAVQWDGKERPKWTEQLPNALQDPKQEHLTVSGVTNSPLVDLPIRDGTMLSALSVQTPKGKEISAWVLTRGDNTHAVYVENSGTAYKLTYVLTPDSQHGHAPFANRTLKVTDTNWHGINPSLFPGEEKSSASHLANYIANNFTYDASTNLRDKLASTSTANDYLHTVYDGGRCDCIECATAAALLAERVRPGQKLLLGAGYLNDVTSGAGHSYLESNKAHAWLIDANGSIIDATAKKADKNSNVPVHSSDAAMDEKMEDGGWSAASKAADTSTAKAATAANQDKHSPLRGWEGMALSGLGVLAVAGLWHEARKRTVTKGALALVRNGQWLASAAKVHPGKAASAMAWQAYGDGKTAMPAHQPGHIPLVDNIPTSTLQEIAKGALRSTPQLTRPERRGIQRMAKLLLAERRRNDKSTQ